jgi:hypothetical protein
MLTIALTGVHKNVWCMHFVQRRNIGGVSGVVGIWAMTNPAVVVETQNSINEEFDNREAFRSIVMLQSRCFGTRREEERGGGLRERSWSER